MEDLSIRMAILEDVALLFLCANDPDVRKNVIT
jgi:hypothetical protein